MEKPPASLSPLPAESSGFLASSPSNLPHTHVIDPKNSSLLLPPNLPPRRCQPPHLLLPEAWRALPCHVSNLCQSVLALEHCRSLCKQSPLLSNSSLGKTQRRPDLELLQHLGLSS